MPTILGIAASCEMLDAWGVSMSNESLPKSESKELKSPSVISIYKCLLMQDEELKEECSSECENRWFEQGTWWKRWASL